MNKIWRRISSKKILNSNWLKVYKNSYLIPQKDVVIPEYYITERKDATTCVCYIPSKDEFIMVSQYRPAVDQVVLCHPGGVIESDETIVLNSALRELLEETGYTPYDTIRLGKYAQIPAVTTSSAHIFLALCESNNVSQPTPDITEDIEVFSISRKELFEKINNEEINCLGCVAASYRAIDLLNKNLLDDLPSE